MSRSVYISNPMLKPMLPMLSKEWNVLGSWDSPVSTIGVTALASTVWEKIDATYLKQFPHLKIICHLGIGTDNIDKHYLKAHGIQLLSQPNAGIHDTAELALTLMLTLTRNIIPNDKYTRSNHWVENKPRFLGNHLLGKQLGLVGLGQIGCKIAHFAEAFGMKIAYTARSRKENKYTYFEHINRLAAISDYLILCCSGGPDTEHLVNFEVLNQLGPKGYLINVSRGSVVNQSALIKALSEGIIAGAALDVYANEPEVPEALRQLSNVVLSPHMGSSTKENLHLMYELQAQQLNHYLKDLVPASAE